MSQKQESLSAELRKILSRGGRPVINKSSNGKVVPVPEEAEVFEIDFTKDGESYGKVYVSVDGLHQLIVYFDEKVSNSPKNGSADSESWEQLVRTLKRFATMKQLSFKLTDLDNLENDMAKREHTKRQESVYEGYHAQGKKASYNDNIPECKMIIKHSRNIEEGEQRYRNIAQIFIENTLGERFLAPTTKPGLARVYARHIAEGGKANDDRWNHINGLCEEYQKMAGFVRATRNGQFNESAQQLVAEGVNHYQKLRECLGKMSGKRGYNAYFESYTPSLMEDEESVDLSEMFMSSSLDPRIEGVMTILSKLSKNITETTDMAETVALEEWADNIIGECPETAPAKAKPSDKEVAKRMHAILSKGKTTDEGMAGAALGGVAGAALTKTPGGAMSGASMGSEIEDKMMSEEPAIKSSKPANKEVAKRMHSILSKSIDKSNMARIKTQQDIGSRVTAIGAGKIAEQGSSETKSMPKDPNAPKLVQDRKTGKWYDPNKEFEKTMNKPEVQAQMKRMKNMEEDIGPEQKAAGQFSPKDAYAKPGSLVGTNESVDPLDRIKEIMNHRR